MKKLSDIFLAVCLFSALIGFFDLGGPMISGFFRAIAAVFFILTFVAHVIRSADAEESNLTK